MRSLWLQSILVLLVLWAGPALSQGEFLYKGEVGGGGSFDVVTGKDATTMSVSAGFCAKGILDLGFGYGWVSDSRIPNVTGEAATGSLTVYLSSQERDRPTPAIGVFGSYTYTSFDLRGYPTKTDDAVTFGLVVSQNVNRNGTMLVQPMFELMYFSGTPVGMGGSISVALGGRIEGGPILAVAPAIAYKGSQFFFGVSLIVVS